MLPGVQWSQAKNNGKQLCKRQKLNQKRVLKPLLVVSVEKDIPENAEWIDDAFYIKKTRFGLFTSILREPLGQHFITGATYEEC